MMRGMVIDMNDQQLLTLAQLQGFLNGTVAVDFAVAAEERYDFIARTGRSGTRPRGPRRRTTGPRNSRRGAARARAATCAGILPKVTIAGPCTGSLP